MKKIKNILLCAAFMAVSFSAKGQYQSIQWVNSVEYVKFSSSFDSESGILYTPIQRPLSYRLGIDVQWGLKSNLSLRTGLRLALINQFRKNVYFCTVGVTDIQIHSGDLYKDINLEVPIGIRYRFKTQKRFQSYIEPFGSAVFNLNSRVFPEIGLAYGIEYCLTKRLGIFAQPTYRHTFNDKISRWSKQSRDIYSLELGIRLKKK